MTTRRKVLLIILVAVFLVEASIYWQSKQISAIEKLNKEIADDLSKLHKMITEARFAIENGQQLPPPTNGVTSSYHDEKDGKKNYEDADIQDLNKKTGLVLVITKDSKISITFKPSVDNFQKFHIGWIAPVTFQCAKINKGKCDFNSPYKLFVGNGLVEVKQLKFSKK